MPRRNKRRTRIPWTAEEDALVLTLHVAEVVRRTNRTAGSVSGRKSILKRKGAALPDLRRKEGRLSVGRWTWTAEADEIVFRHPPAVAAKLLGRTARACWGRRAVLKAPPLARPPKPTDNRLKRYQARWTEAEDRILRTTTAKEAKRLLPPRSIAETIRIGPLPNFRVWSNLIRDRVGEPIGPHLFWETDGEL